MLDVKHGKQGLIDGADTVGRQQWPLALGEPGRGGQAFLRIVGDAPQMPDVLVHRRAAMHQLHIQRPLGELREEGKRPLEQRVAGGLGRQRHIETTMIVGGLETQVGKKGEFGLALAHRRLHQQQGRSTHTLQQAVTGLLQRTCGQFGATDDTRQYPIGI
ncbi:hypothetical protein D9M70_531240 [compost metagenome]